MIPMPKEEAKAKMHPAFENVEINLAELPKFEELSLERISSKYKFLLYIYSSIAFSTLLMGTIFLNISTEWAFWYVAIAPPAILIWWIVAAHFQYIHLGYALRTRDILFQSGWIVQTTTVIPFDKIQHGEVRQNLIERSLGISRLKLYSAGGTSSDLSIPGLPYERAQQLRAYCLNTDHSSNDH